MAPNKIVRRKTVPNKTSTKRRTIGLSGDQVGPEGKLPDWLAMTLGSDGKIHIGPENFVGGQNATKKFQQGPAYTTGMTMMNGVQTMVVEKTEALATVVATTTTFDLLSQSFFPGSSGLPWLQTISAAFVEYQVMELEFTYVPSVPTTQAGSVMLAFTGDFQDTNPATQADFLQSEQALLAPVYAGGAGGRALQRFGFPSGDVIGFSVPKYTYSLGTTSQPNTYRIVNNTTFNGYGNTDKNLYAPGKLIVGWNGVTGATVATPVTVGQLFVRYRLRLLGAVKAANNT